MEEKRVFKLDKQSYEKYLSASHEEVNTLLTNVYNAGYEYGRLNSSNDNMIESIENALNENKIKGVGKATIEKIMNIIRSVSKDEHKSNDEQNETKQ